MTTSNRLSDREHIDILLREYGALYGLIQLRLSALETRAMLAWAALGGFLTGLVALPQEHWIAMCVATPPLLAWLFRTTVNHARSLEDAFRRVEEIEHHVNKIADAELLVFQSTHPSRGKAVGGRTGRESLYAVLTTSVVILAVMALFVWPSLDGTVRWLSPALGLYLGLFALYLIHTLAVLRRYRYTPTPTA